MNGCPATVKSTVRTMPAGPLGVSAVDRLILSIRLFEKSDVSNFAASSALPSNHRQGVILLAITNSSYLEPSGAPPSTSAIRDHDRPAVSVPPSLGVASASSPTPR